MARIDDFYRELVSQSTSASPKLYSVGDVLGRFPISPTLIYPKFDQSKLAGVTATPDELAGFVKVYISQFKTYFSNGNTNDNLLDMLAPLAFIAFYQAKHELGGVFGLDSSATLFASALRPITVTASNATPQQNWNFNITTAGWNTSFFTFNTANVNSSTPDLNLYNNVTMLILGFIDESPSARIQELQFVTPSGVKEGVKEYPMNGIPGGTNILLLDQAYYIGKNLKYTVDVNFSATGAAKIIPIGIQFMTSQYFNQE